MAAPQTSVSLQQTVSFKGQLGDSSMLKDCASYVNSETSAEVPFGIMVKQGTADDALLLCTSTSDKFLGVTGSFARL
jgi:hypothetical protein